MCTTCGCDGDGQVRVISLDAPAHDHDHEHDHPHDHAHSHHHSSPDESTRTVLLEQDVLAKNNLLAERNRGWLLGRRTTAINLMSSPGSGKTTLLERTIRELGPDIAISVIEGDQETAYDAERIKATGSPVVQINTGSGCHLDADMVQRGLTILSPPVDSMVFIENVGNLVCPALFDLGESLRVVITSVTEGADKPRKYPHMFKNASLVLVNKIDLLPYVDFDLEQFRLGVHQLNPGAHLLPVSATGGDGLPDWYAWLRQSVPAG